MGLRKFFKNFVTKSDEEEEIPIPEQDRSDITILQKEPSPKAIKKKYVYIALFTILAFVMVGLAFGFSDDEKRTTNKAKIDANRELNSKAVTGEHLKDVPKSYAEQEELNRKQEEAAAKAKAKEKSNKKATGSSTQEKPVAHVPAVPQQPQIPRQQYNRQLTPAEKARLIAIEKRNKALESKIRFDLEKGDSK